MRAGDWIFGVDWQVKRAKPINEPLRQYVLRIYECLEIVVVTVLPVQV
jgi:hypothetical protein